MPTSSKKTAKKSPAKAAAKKAAPKAPAKARVRKPVIKKNSAPVVAPVSPLGKTGPFYVEVEMNGKIAKGRTSDIAAAVQSLAPDRINTKVSMRFSLYGKKKGKVVDKVFMIPMARRLFINKMSADILTKAVTMALGYDGKKAK